jgi:DNA-directed RNA polymerase subunit RPC12/RpoP
MYKKKCIICGKIFDERGNNPAPVKTHGSCCNYCNLNEVIPVRMKLMR